MACRLVGAKPWSEPMSEYFNWSPANKLQWNFNQNSYIFIHENLFQNVVRKMAAILSRPQCDNERPPDTLNARGSSCKHCKYGKWKSLRWRHNDHAGVSNHQPRGCLLNRLFRSKSKENIKAPRNWPLCGKFTGDRWISRTNGQLRGKCFHLMTSSWFKSTYQSWW